MAWSDMASRTLESALLVAKMALRLGVPPAGRPHGAERD